MKVILTRAELIQLARTTSTMSREIDNSEWGITASTPDCVVVDRFLEVIPEWKHLVENDTYIMEIRERKYIAALKIIDSNMGDLVRMGKGIWMMVQCFKGSVKRIGREIEAVLKR